MTHSSELTIERLIASSRSAHAARGACVPMCKPTHAAIARWPWSWRIRGLLNRCGPASPAFVLAEAFAAQGVRVAPDVRYRSSSSGQLVRRHGSFRRRASPPLTTSRTHAIKSRARGRLLLRRLETGSGGPVPWPVRSCPSWCVGTVRSISSRSCAISRRSSLRNGSGSASLCSEAEALGPLPLVDRRGTLRAQPETDRNRALRVLRRASRPTA